MWPVGPTPCYLQSLVVSASQSFTPVTPFLFLTRVPFWAFFFKIQKGVWPYRYAYDIPLVTLILNIYGFVDLAPFFFLAKVTFLAFLYGKGCGHINMLMMFPW